MESLIKASIDAIAPTISTQALGFVYHRPETWAAPLGVLRTSTGKVVQRGGRIQFGWRTSHHRYVELISGAGGPFVTHHAVWHAPYGPLVDVTPYPNGKHRPPGPSGSILFLVDDEAQPIKTEKLIAPMPLRFFALSNDRPLVAYVQERTKKEQETCQAIFAGGSKAASLIWRQIFQACGSVRFIQPSCVSQISNSFCPGITLVITGSIWRNSKKP